MFVLWWASLQQSGINTSSPLELLGIQSYLERWVVRRYQHSSYHHMKVWETRLVLLYRDTCNYFKWSSIPLHSSCYLNVWAEGHMCRLWHYKAVFTILCWRVDPDPKTWGLQRTYTGLNPRLYGPNKRLKPLKHSFHSTSQRLSKGVW